MRSIASFTLLLALIFLGENFACRKRGAASPTLDSLEEGSEAGVSPPLGEQIKNLEVQIDQLKDKLKKSDDLSEEDRQKMLEDLQKMQIARQEMEAAAKKMLASIQTPEQPIVPQVGSAGQKRYIFAGTDCIEIPGNRSDEGLPLRAVGCANQVNQHWVAEAIDAFSFRIVAQNTAPNNIPKCLHIAGASINEGALLEQFTCLQNGDTSQHFQFMDIQNQLEFKLKNLHSGLCLKIAPNGQIIQGSCMNNFTLFKWSLVK